MQFPGQQRGAVVVEDVQQQMAADDGSLGLAAGRGARVHLDLHRQHLLRMAGQSELMRQSGKADECG